VRAVRSDMGRPEFERAGIPMAGPPGEVVEEPLDVDGTTYRVTCISMGNPHAVLFVERVADVPLERLGAAIETHPAFPQRINVEFVEVVDRHTIRVRVWERGSGTTLACGSGTCAAAVAAMRTGRTERIVTAQLELGTLEIEWAEDGCVYMTGPAAEVYTGQWPDRAT